MPHQPTRGGITEMLSARTLLFYLVLAVIVFFVGRYLYSYITTPLVRFEEYGISTIQKVATTGYKETFLDEPDGRLATLEIGLPSNVALEEAQATMVSTMADLYKRRPDVDVITVTAFYDFNFGQAAYFSLGSATWGINGQVTPVVHKRNKKDYKIQFLWRTKLPTIDERTLAESQLKAHQDAMSQK
jgi:hypothetical protein